jgi:putative resolvase
LKDVGSGLNYKRKNFTALMDMVERGEVAEIVIAHQDRLVRFGYDWFERLCNNQGTTITVMNIERLSPEEEVTQDLLSIIHCFSSRLYGLRRHQKTIADLVKTEAHADDKTD